MPGGWVDALKTITEKEVKEDVGLDVVAKRLIAVQDRNKHNLPPYAYNVCKAFVMCEIIGGEFIANNETTGIGYFGLDELPLLAEEKTSKEQIAMCSEPLNAPNWLVVFD